VTASPCIVDTVEPETAEPASIRDHLRMPLRDYFELPADRMPGRLSSLLAAFERALSARGETVTGEFRDGLMQALPALRTFALSLTGDATRADDLVQETMLRAWTNHHRFEPGTRLIAWLFTIQRNLFYSEIRKRKREVEDADGVHAAGLTALAEQDDAVALKSLYEKLEFLPATQRDALLLVGAEGFTYVEAAEILACRVGTVKSRVSRARTQLAELLGESRAAEDAAA
jgi:RNA polymerase sigma-70 factor, ECF subfamily